MGTIYVLIIFVTLVVLLAVNDLFIKYIGCNKPVQATVVGYRKAYYDDDVYAVRSHVIVRYEYKARTYQEELIGLKVPSAEDKYPINSTLTVYLDPNYPYRVAPSKEDRRNF